MKTRAMVYIDGYNWYHAIFKHRPDLKWLDIQKFFETLRPHEEIIGTKVFTAIVDEDKLDSPARKRHLNYLNALKTNPKIKVIKGKFQDREVTCRGDCRLKYKVPEEKKTDVNIAVELMSDAIDNASDMIIAVSGDSDLQPPIAWIKRRYPDKRILVYIPVLPAEQPKRRLDYYPSIKVECNFLPLNDLSACQLPNQLQLKSGDWAIRPHCWH